MYVTRLGLIVRVRSRTKVRWLGLELALGLNIELTAVILRFYYYVIS